MRKSLVDWDWALGFAFGQFLAAWHYATPSEAVARGVGVFVLYVAVAWITERIIGRALSRRNVEAA